MPTDVGTIEDVGVGGLVTAGVVVATVGVGAGVVTVGVGVAATKLADWPMGLPAAVAALIAEESEFFQAAEIWEAPETL